MAITIDTASGSVTLKEMYENYDKGIANGGPTIRKQYLCDWDKGDSVANALMGITTNVGGLTGTILRQAPHHCPESPGLWAMDVGPIHGLGETSITGGRPTYQYAIVPVTYGSPAINFGAAPGAGGGAIAGNTADPYNLQTPDQQSYPFCKFDLETGTETYTLPETAYKWVDDSTPANRLPTSIQLNSEIGVSSIVCTIFSVPFLPFLRLITLKKRVNNATFFGFGAGYVLYENARSSRTWNSDGSMVQDLILNFKVREYPWNTFLHPTPGRGFIAISDDGLSTGNKPLKSDDLRPLIYGVSL